MLDGGADVVRVGGAATAGGGGRVGIGDAGAFGVRERILEGGDGLSGAGEEVLSALEDAAGEGVGVGVGMHCGREEAVVPSTSAKCVYICARRAWRYWENQGETRGRVGAGGSERRHGVISPQGNTRPRINWMLETNSSSESRPAVNYGKNGKNGKVRTPADLSVVVFPESETRTDVRGALTHSHCRISELKSWGFPGSVLFNFIAFGSTSCT